MLCLLTTFTFLEAKYCSNCASKTIRYYKQSTDDWIANQAKDDPPPLNDRTPAWNQNQAKDDASAPVNNGERKNVKGENT